ncbi:PorT family protein [Flavihumibacter rivuli]|uniref:outer membrane beta-barrel protein n=1 Tax=Flavihumibacter rivuli TaxID=2838156 RepID=UPI001BDEADAD|nr:outer membrane beta-barrel protein [Flavihumibacter rivuli]ULQ56551.1 PorT family protein [Flavihumibacter rivuli]
MRSLLLSLVTLLTVSFVSAQTVLKPTAGLNFTDWSKDEGGTVKSKTGWQIGLSAEIGKKIYFEPGLYYVGKKTEVSVIDQETELNFDADVNGIRVPLAVGIRLLGDQKTAVQLRGFGGVSGFFITSVGDELDEDAIEKTNWGLFAGAGVDIWKIFIDLSYEWSLTNVQKDVEAIDVGKARSLYIQAGLRLNIGK